MAGSEFLEMFFRLLLSFNEPTGNAEMGCCENTIENQVPLTEAILVSVYYGNRFL
ncbi:MAG: hypothetical protein Ct9H300mP28_09320 [Pseudomonadota bacterium]|nr:MAG: hypothetical protein Ct9H300mP28_09320 [Pseudomonadota bacterium]